MQSSCTKEMSESVVWLIETIVTLLHIPLRLRKNSHHKEDSFSGVSRIACYHLTKAIPINSIHLSSS